MKATTIATGLVLVALFGAGRAQAQVGTAFGKVVDGDGAPVPGAHVRLEAADGSSLSFRATANDKGEFTVATTQSLGPWQIVLEKPGYQAIVLPEPVRVPFGERTDLGALTIWKDGDPRAPVRVTKEEAEKIKAQREAFKAIQTEFAAAEAIVSEAKAAQAAGDTATVNAKLAEAEAAYQAIIAKDPSIAEVYFNLAVVYKGRREWDKTAATYLKALELKPDMIEAVVGAAAAYQNAGKMAEAIELLVDADKKHPNDPNITYRLGEAFYNSGDYANATTWLQKAVSLAPQNPEPLYYLGTMALSDDTQKSIKLLEKYLSMNPTNPQNVQAAKDLLAAVKSGQ
jgi:Flp pilus assembly protein TadD